MVFVHGQGADALQRFTLPRAQIKAVAHQVTLHAQVLCQGHTPSAADLLQHHMQHQRRALAQQRCHGLGPGVLAGRLQRSDDGGHIRQTKKMIHIGPVACVACVSSYAFCSNPLLHRLPVSKRLLTQSLPQRCLLV